jgi:hypothetical protein
MLTRKRRVLIVVNFLRDGWSSVLLQRVHVSAGEAVLSGVVVCAHFTPTSRCAFDAATIFLNPALPRGGMS